MTSHSSANLAESESARRDGAWLIWLALTAAVLGALHHFDYITRGNHVGWPVIPQVTPFTFSLLVYPALLGGAYFTARGRLSAWYWLVVSVAMLFLVVNVHFNPNPEAEQVKDIYLPYADPAAYCAAQSAADPPSFRRVLCEPTPAASRPYIGVLAVANMLALVVTLALLVIVSMREVWRARRSRVTGAVGS